MIMFLDDICARRQRENRLQSMADLREAIILGLLPIMWSNGMGADVMKRIAAPIIGGMVKATVLTLLVNSVMYFICRSRSLKSRIQGA